MRRKIDFSNEGMRSKIRATKWFFAVMVVIFATCVQFGHWFALDDQITNLFGHFTYICIFHYLLNAWVDTADTAAMTARQSCMEYWVIVTHLYISWLCHKLGGSFVNGLIILVLPVYFTKEAQSPKTQFLYGVLHFAEVLYMFEFDLRGESTPWLVNLLIVNFVVIDMSLTRQEAKEVRISLHDTLKLNESLLHTAYDATCLGSFNNTELGGLQPMIAFGTPELSELFGWWKSMDGVVLDNSIIICGLDDIRNFFVEASQTQSMPEYRRRVLATCRDARGATFEAEFRVAPQMHRDVSNKECFFLGVRIVGEKRQSLDGPMLEGEEPSSENGTPSADEGATAATVDDEPLPLAPLSGTPLWSWLFGQQAPHAHKAHKPFDCREACWQVLTLVPGLLAARCSTKGRLEVTAGTTDLLRCFPAISQRPVYELVTQDMSMYMRRKLTNMSHATDYALTPKTVAVLYEDFGTFELRGDAGHASILVALVSAQEVSARGASARKVSARDEQAEPQFLVLISRQEGMTKSFEKPPDPRGSLRARVLRSDDGLGSATSAAGLKLRAEPHMRPLFR